MQAALEWLFDRSMGCPGPTGHWPLWLTIVFHAANLTIAATDLTIPAIILTSWKYRRDGVTRRAIWTVLLYFPVKAGSRLVRAIEYGGPTYNLAAILDAMTAVLAVYAACQLGPFIRFVMQVRQKVHDLNGRLQVLATEERIRRIETERQNARLLGLLDDARRTLAPDVWLDDKYAALDRIAEAIRHGR